MELVDKTVQAPAASGQVPDPYTPSRLLMRALHERGWEVQGVRLRGRLYLTFVAPNGYRWMTAKSVTSFPFVPSSAVRVSVNKQAAYEYAQQFGVHVPATLVLPSSESEISLFFEQHKPVIVKPLDAHGSHGLSLNLVQSAQLSVAVQKALSFSDAALMQEQVTGDEIRFTVLNGEVVSALLRQTPRLRGNGQSTVAELLAAENASRSKIELEYIQYPQLDERLVALAELDMQRVLDDGEELELNKSTMIRGGASVYNITDTVHSSYKQTVLRLARSLSPEFLVVDMMLHDYKSPQTDQNYAFIEFNTAPALKMYYSCRDGKQYDMVPKLVEMLERIAARAV